MVDQHLHEVEDDVLAADRHHALGRRVGRAEVLGVALADRFLQLHCAAGSGVLGEIVLDGPDGRLFDVVGGGEVRLPGAEVDQVHAPRTQFLGVARHFHCGRDADARDSFR